MLGIISVFKYISVNNNYINPFILNVKKYKVIKNKKYLCLLFLIYENYIFIIPQSK